MKNILMLILVGFTNLTLFGQVPPDPSPRNSGPGSGPQELPLDQYTILLVIALLAVAVWFYKKNILKLVK